ncbi:hypothetical protein COW81_02975 [Candidatus Campbellbacteria bacterium CG22_combo_CG10-13_8_21_14_all_36_13]|uniref:Uncharacterized protein n=1 Tax=Candidatus Campbellbacteria bacterium CG22_combo_CG10-13_8_21_14_all_36_13 TaxID=1974529 RepID=A0A2H0DZC8_9BACT|nr:MAG: hypothetical protein COW81_02975 [Candidatus Campbellbacteria bacterium CG22_combo_CG10-13_8_21_14_all_36_13]
MRDTFKKTAESPFTILLISIFLLFFHVYPAFLLEKADIFIRDSFWFQLSASISAFIILFLFPIYIFGNIF